jgi:hypothetical protein
MFGMLDYRAYKLLWLICWPLRLVMFVGSWGAVFIAIMISSSIDVIPLYRIVIAYAIWEGFGIVLSILRWLIFWFIKKCFFWLVDIIPSKGENVAQAKEMVVGGPMMWMGKKFMNDIGNWTDDETEELAALVNVRARWFFGSTERIRKRIWRFADYYEQTGQQPIEMTEKERNELTADLDYSWFEKAIINPIAFGSIVKIVVITIAILSFNNPHT